MENTSDNDWLKEIESRLAASTPGPWKYEEKPCTWHTNCTHAEIDLGERHFGPGSFNSEDFKDAEFMAHSRTDVEKLTKALRVAMDKLDFIRLDAGTDVAVVENYKTKRIYETARDTLAAIEKMGD